MDMVADRKNAYLLNFTANSYHWGCFGTSVALYDALIERGYYVSYLPVEATHNQMAELPTQIADFDSEAVAKRFTEANIDIARQIANADLVVCNGEGTLHHHAVGPWQLLYLLYYARKYHNKKVAVINQSTYPGGGLEAAEQVDGLYGAVLSNCTHVASREIHSTDVLQRIGVKPTQSFDCLPRFIDRHGFERKGNPDGPILISGGVSLSREQVMGLAEAVAPLAKGGRAIHYLTGAKGNPAGEDKVHFALMKEKLPSLELVDADSVSAWLKALGGASVLISARFHHTIGAASLLTPVVCLPSNTPKIEAICTMMGLKAPIDPNRDGWQAEVTAAGRTALDGGAPLMDERKWAEILALTEANFTGL